MISGRPIPPVAFEDAANRAHMYLDSDFEYNWRDVTRRSTIPAGQPCIVVCREKGRYGILESRCLAFAVRNRGHIAWFGVTHRLQSPVELRAVRGFVRVDEIDEVVRGYFQ